GPPRYRLPPAGTERRRIVGRIDVHRHGLPLRLLSKLSLLPDLFPAHGYRALPGGDRARSPAVGAAAFRTDPAPARLFGVLNRGGRTATAAGAHRSRMIAASRPRLFVPRRPLPCVSPCP